MPGNLPTHYIDASHSRKALVNKSIYIYIYIYICIYTYNVLASSGTRARVRVPHCAQVHTVPIPAYCRTIAPAACAHRRSLPVSLSLSREVLRPFLNLGSCFEGAPSLRSALLRPPLRGAAAQKRASHPTSVRRYPAALPAAVAATATTAARNRGGRRRLL